MKWCYYVADDIEHDREICNHYCVFSPKEPLNGLKQNMVLMFPVSANQVIFKFCNFVTDMLYNY